jgi:microcystin-dependent protein
VITSGSSVQPTLALNYIIALQGIYPSRSWDQPTLGQVSLFAGNFAPRGWALCDGRLLPITSYSALFSLLGTYYGGDGQTTFALPDLRGRVVVSSGPGNSGLNLNLGGMTGSVQHQHGLQ